MSYQRGWVRSSDRSSVCCGATEIGLLHALVFSERLARSECRDQTGLQNIAATCGLQCVACILLDKQYAGAAGVDRNNSSENIVDDPRCESQRGFIKTKQTWFGHHGAAQNQHLLFTATERSGALGGATAKLRKHVEHHFDQPANLNDVLAVFKTTEFQILAHSQERKDMTALRDQGDAELGTVIRRQAGNIATIKADHSSARRQRAGNSPQYRALTSSVRSDQGDNLAGIDGDRDIAACCQFAVGEFETFGIEQRRHRTLAPR